MNLGYAVCGSFCTFEKAFVCMENLKKEHNIFPIMSENAYNTDTRFGKSEDIRKKFEDISENKIINSITTAEPLGPKKILDALLIAPCTGNTISKMANGITDTSVTMAGKSCLRLGIPVVIALCTNDALSGSFMSFGKMMNTKNVYFVPMYQDDPVNKPSSLVADFTKIEETLEKAMKKEQIQPIF